MSVRCVLILNGFLIYRRLNVSFKVGPELFNFTDDFVGGGLEKRVSNMISGEGKYEKELQWRQKHI